MLKTFSDFDGLDNRPFLFGVCEMKVLGARSQWDVGRVLPIVVGLALNWLLWFDLGVVKTHDDRTQVNQRANKKHQISNHLTLCQQTHVQ